MLLIHGCGNVCEPVGQDEIAAMIMAAVKEGRGQEGRAHAVQDSGKSVFLVAGGLRRPRRIALLGLEGKTEYEFRGGRVRFAEDGPWVKGEDCEEAERVQFERLVNVWESARLEERELMGR